MQQQVACVVLQRRMFSYGVLIQKRLSLIAAHAHKVIYIGLARTTYLRCTYGMHCRDFFKYTAIYDVYIYGSG
jgi:hypothetical protein